MSSSSETVRRHYEAGGQAADPFDTILAALDDTRDIIGAFDLEALDQFHAGGAAATLKLGELLGVPSGSRILDAGSGLGGPARVIAEVFGHHVTGIDLTPRYVDLAQKLADRTGLASRVQFQVGDLLALPFAAETFDAVYSQHVVMNIADRDALYQGLRRVLKPGGGFVFHDVIAADSGERPVYPTPWAETAATSHLLDEDQTIAALDRARLRLADWDDVTADAATAIAALGAATPVGPTLAAIMGPRFREMAQNFGRNLREGRLRVVMGRAIAF